jgi:hypothetical protein
MKENQRMKNAIKIRIGPAAANTLLISPIVVLKVLMKMTKKTRLISRLKNAAPLFTPHHVMIISTHPNANSASIMIDRQKDWLFLFL